MLATLRRRLSQATTHAQLCHTTGLTHLAYEDVQPAAHRVGGQNTWPVAYIVPGLLGQGRNWRGWANRLCARLEALGCPWRFVLVDVRHHGRSTELYTAPPPDTVAAAAGDLADLASAVGQPRAVIGHSLGGKIALAYAERQGVA